MRRFCLLAVGLLLATASAVVDAKDLYVIHQGMLIQRLTDDQGSCAVGWHIIVMDGAIVKATGKKAPDTLGCYQIDGDDLVTDWGLGLVLRDRLVELGIGHA